jgi:hypothetical protein
MARPKKGKPEPEPEPKKGPKKKPAKKAPPLLPGAEGLTFKQRLFVAFYLGQANGNATEAARMAGYATPHPEGARLLRNATVRAAVDAHLAHAAMSADEILARLSEIASVDMGDFITVHSRGHRLDLKKAKNAGKLHLVKKLIPTKNGLSIELQDAFAALVQLARYHGLFVDRSDDRPASTESLADPEAAKRALMAADEPPAKAGGR